MLFPGKIIEIVFLLTCETFTTAGKPTKTIETPWGPKEIYDPVQDNEIIQAYSKIKKQNYNSIKELYADGSSYDYANHDVELLFLAREIHHLDVMRSGCKRLISYECGTSRNGDVRLLKNSCDVSSVLGHPRSACEGDFYSQKIQSRANGCALDLSDKVLQPNIYYQLLSSDAVGRPNVPQAKNPREGLTHFYDYQCQKW